MNKHYEDATGFIDEATDASVWSIEQQPTVASMAIAEATLALAYEQRTANLIAAFGQEDLDSSGVHCIDYSKLSDQIKERLNLA